LEPRFGGVRWHQRSLAGFDDLQPSGLYLLIRCCPPDAVAIAEFIETESALLDFHDHIATLAGMVPAVALASAQAHGDENDSFGRR